jgi:hypothetical protein
MDNCLGEHPFRWMLDCIFQKIGGSYVKNVNCLHCDSSVYIDGVGVTNRIPKVVRADARRKTKGCRGTE